MLMVQPRPMQLQKWCLPTITMSRRSYQEKSELMPLQTPLTRILENHWSKRMISLSQQVHILDSKVPSTTRRLPMSLRRSNLRFTMEAFQELVPSNLFSVKFLMLTAMDSCHMLTLKEHARNFKFKLTKNLLFMQLEPLTQTKRATLTTGPSQRRCSQVWVRKWPYLTSTALRTFNCQMSLLQARNFWKTIWRKRPLSPKPFAMSEKASTLTMSTVSLYSPILI